MAGSARVAADTLACGDPVGADTGVCGDPAGTDRGVRGSGKYDGVGVPRASKH